VSQEQSFNNSFVDLSFYLSQVVSSLLDCLKDSRKGSFVPDVHPLTAGVVHKLRVFLVDSIVSEMDELLL
jgi:hypothetical protein